ncbi:hypothetical protein ACH41E_01045 [Streptomyces sp. NPDC020412]|uniref:hypothetical protein n=1 Tax=Streptomyces sp. NPDC020412 TaxID=3365073 RepID=UPI00378B5DE9
MTGREPYAGRHRGQYVVQPQSWRPHPVPAEGVDVTVICVSGHPECGVRMPDAGGPAENDHEYAGDWMTYHLVTTGHALYSRTVHDTVQLRPRNTAA